jgi:hypothetical protein
MNFEKIKCQWESSFKQEEQLNSDQLKAMLKIRESSNTALQKLIRNHIVGLIINALTYLILVIGLFVFIQAPASYIWMAFVTVLMAVVFFFSGRSYNRIRKVQVADEQLKPALEITINEATRNLKFGMGNLYKFVLIPLALILGITIGIYIASGDAGFWETVQSLERKSIIKIILVIVVGSAITIPFSQLTMKRMYKQHVDELKRCLKEFDEEIENQK